MVPSHPVHPTEKCGPTPSIPPHACPHPSLSSKQEETGIARPPAPSAGDNTCSPTPPAGSSVYGPGSRFPTQGWVGRAWARSPILHARGDTRSPDHPDPDPPTLPPSLPPPPTCGDTRVRSPRPRHSPCVAVQREVRRGGPLLHLHRAPRPWLPIRARCGTVSPESHRHRRSRRQVGR